MHMSKHILSIFPNIFFSQKSEKIKKLCKKLIFFHKNIRKKSNFHKIYQEKKDKQEEFERIFTLELQGLARGFFSLLEIFLWRSCSTIFFVVDVFGTFTHYTNYTKVWNNRKSYEDEVKRVKGKREPTLFDGERESSGVIFLKWVALCKKYCAGII